MGLGVLLDPIGFAADLIAIGNALRIPTPAQKAQSQEFMDAIMALQIDLDPIKDIIADAEAKISNVITTAAIIEVRSRLHPYLAVDKRLVNTMLQLFFILKQISNIAFAVIIRYKVGPRAATLGIAGSTADSIEDLVSSLERLNRAIKASGSQGTALVGARSRGRRKSELENRVCAVLCCTVSAVLGFPAVSKADDIYAWCLVPSGSKTVVLLRSQAVELEKPDYDVLRRVFLIGDTRTGKSALGNAMTRTNNFKVSKGMTGTMHIDCKEVVRDVSGTIWVTKIYDTPGLNDKDVFYQAAIEDKILALQQASELVLTIAVDAGITNTTQTAVNEYKSLFGEGMVNMLIVVLTTNVSADKDEYQELIEFNWPTLRGLIEGISRSNVMCLSFEDLRSTDTSDSYEIVDELLLRCQAMELKVIEFLSARHRKINANLHKKRDEVKRAVDETIDEGWTAHEELTDGFEAAPYAQVGPRFFPGFVFNRNGMGHRGQRLLSLRKIAVQIDFKEESIGRRIGKEIWQ